MKQSSIIYSTLTDEDLLQLLRRNDAQAFADLYDRYRHELYSYILTIVKTAELAEDLVQDVFVKVWEARGRLEIRLNFRSYLFRMAHNGAIDMLKQIAASRKLFDQLLHHYQVLPDPEQQSPQELLQLDSLLEAALNSLSPQRRRIYELCKKEKKSYEEVARELNISVNTVKAHITQTLSFLRNYVVNRDNLPILILLVKKFL